MIKHIPSAAFCSTMSSQTALAADATADGTWGIAFWVFVGYCILIIIPHALRVFMFLISPRAGTETNVSETEA